MFYIRTDANPTIATGHVMRCMSIAKEINILGEEVTFITADMQAQELIDRNGYPVICLNSKWDHLEEELNQLITIIQDYKIGKLLIDSYYVTERYLKELRKHTKIIYVDDLATFEYPVDVLINYNNYAKTLGYEKWATKTGTKLVLGCSYAPLRSEFKDIVREKRMNIKSILITTGGADSNHVALKLLRYFIKEYFNKDIDRTQKYISDLIRNIEIHVVVGKFNSDKKLLQKIQNAHTNITLHMDVTNMSELMRNSDLAITAGGSTMYELCACGVPMITYSFADNQLLGVKGFDQMGVAKYCGDILEGEEALWKNIMETLEFHVLNLEEHNKITERMQSIIDGNGACRLAEILLEYPV